MAGLGWEGWCRDWIWWRSMGMYHRNVLYNQRQYRYTSRFSVPWASPASSFVRGLVLTRTISLAECNRCAFAAIIRMQYNWSGESPVMMTFVSFLSLSPMIDPLSWMRCFATEGLSGTAQRREIVSAVTASRATRGTAGMSRLSSRMTWSTGRMSSDEAR
jgi:hypothetical protein